MERFVPIPTEPKPVGEFTKTLATGFFSMNFSITYASLEYIERL